MTKQIENLFIFTSFARGLFSDRRFGVTQTNVCLHFSALNGDNLSFTITIETIYFCISSLPLPSSQRAKRERESERDVGCVPFKSNYIRNDDFPIVLSKFKEWFCDFARGFHSETHASTSSAVVSDWIRTNPSNATKSYFLFLLALASHRLSLPKSNGAKINNAFHTSQSESDKMESEKSVDVVYLRCSIHLYVIHAWRMFAIVNEKRAIKSDDWWWFLVRVPLHASLRIAFQLQLRFDVFVTGRRRSRKRESDLECRPDDTAANWKWINK